MASARTGPGMLSAGSGKPGKGGRAARDPIQEAKEAQLAQEAEVYTDVMGLSGLWQDLKRRAWLGLDGLPCMILSSASKKCQKLSSGSRRHFCASAGRGQKLDGCVDPCGAEPFGVCSSRMCGLGLSCSHAWQGIILTDCCTCAGQIPRAGREAPSGCWSACPGGGGSWQP